MAPSEKLSTRFKITVLALVHIACLAVYLIPILTHGHAISPVLDESHIVSNANPDVAGTSTLKEVFTNDYWGRNMNSPSSHKSWRPLTILSFRWLHGSKHIWPALTVYRIVNILANAAAGECVSILAVQIFPRMSDPQSLLLRCLVKLFFCLHPTHVEVTANAANRPHIFAVLAAVVLSDPRLSIATVALTHIVGLLCSETFIFQMPAVAITLLLIQWNKSQRKDFNDVFMSFLTLLPRLFLLVILSVAYLGMRYVLDWLSIPEGLIRPAENPFFPFEGVRRVRNYSYVLVIHIFKSWSLDFIGFSHEYGFECIRELKKWTDPRFGVVLFALALLAYVTKNSFQAGWGSRLLFLFHLSWMATLFPISGVVKVGTFIADRIVVASTVSVSVLFGRWMTLWIFPEGSARPHLLKVLMTLGLFAFMWNRVHIRSLDWMDSFPLLASSLKTCPRSAKSHLEISKVYSGLVPELYNLEKSLSHLEQVESIDPSYCDVHQQFSHVYIQQQRLLEFEERLAKSVLCPFTMSGATDMWRRYWPIVLKDPTTAVEGKLRMDRYQKEIERAVARDEEERNSGKPQWQGATLN
jgi:protein O-mannosyl-transferase